MPTDLKLVTVTNSGNLAYVTWPSADYVDGSYSLVQAIVKCLFTEPGTDVYDPEYGAGLIAELSRCQPDEIGKAMDIAQSAALNVQNQLAPSFANSPDSSQRLLTIRVMDISSDLSDLSWNVSLAVTTEATTITIQV
jgi:hypothetical protein